MDGKLLLLGSLVAVAVAGSSVGAAHADPAGPAPVGRCHVTQLAVHHGPTNGAAGTIGVTISFRNVSPRTCELTGYPGGLRLNKHKHAMQTNLVRGGSTIFSDPGPKRIVLAPRHRASFGLAWSDVPTSGSGCKTSTYLEVTPPNAFHHETVKLSIDACDHGTLHATAVQAGAHPAH
jgi:hypothetical protein